jgi:type I restriction enzyme, S subunit
MVKGPGVVTGRYGTIGQVYFVENDFWPLNTTLYIRDFKGNDPKFICYFLKTVDFLAYSDKAAVPGINRNHLHEAAVIVPPLPVQREIAKFLGALDDRITLLRETNATLEAIAQALFKSWFVDFDPVRAKQEGRAPEGMDEATAALFPDGFEESELGAVPRGWKVTTLAELTSECGGTIQTGPFGSQLHASDYVDSGVPVVMPKDIQNRRVMTDSIAQIHTRDADRLRRHKLESGDIVFSRRGDVERHALISKREVGWLCGTGCLLVRPGDRWPSPTFLSMTLDAQRARNWLLQHAVGATMPNLNTGILGSVPVLFPTFDCLQALERVISVTELQRSHNSSTAETLATLRDTLLPRLISGQLRLPEAEAAIAAAL